MASSLDAVRRRGQAFDLATWLSARSRPFAASAADGMAGYLDELADQRGCKEDEAERDLVEMAQLAAARCEREHHERRCHQDECENVHVSPRGRDGNGSPSAR